MRPYSDFTLRGKLVKATIPLRRMRAFEMIHRWPVRAIRWTRYFFGGDDTRLQYRALQPNFDVYWQPDSDAFVSLDRFETKLWFESRGDECLNCGSTPFEWWSLSAEPLVIRIRE